MPRNKKTDELIQNELKNSGEIPRHIAIIMDGNGRWAQQRGKTRVNGHREGVNSVRDIVEACGQLGVKFLTLYTFSTENWKRPKTEVTILMKLLIKALRDETDRLNKNDVKLICTGDLDSLPDRVRNELLDSIEGTKNNKLMTLNLALSYSGRWDIINAIKKMWHECKKNNLTLEDINEKKFPDFLATNGIPDPDLMIRTGGDYRISNFLLWQLAYTELYIDPVFWPDYRRNHLYKAIEAFQNRERRFGMTSDQIKMKKNKLNN